MDFVVLQTVDLDIVGRIADSDIVAGNIDLGIVVEDNKEIVDSQSLDGLDDDGNCVEVGVEEDDGYNDVHCVGNSIHFHDDNDGVDDYIHALEG